MLNKNAVDQINNDLEKIQQSINEFLKQDARHQQYFADLNIAIRIRMDDDLSKVEEIRGMFFNLRRCLNSFNTPTPQLESCKKNVHDGLVYLAVVKPLNKRNDSQKLICPFSGRTIHSSDKIAFSNGYYYSENAIDVAREGKSHLPVLLNISQFDADAIHQPFKLNVGLAITKLSISIVALLAAIDFILYKTAAASLLTLSMKGLGLLGLSAGVGAAISLGGFILIAAAITALTIFLVIKAYDNKNGSKLAPEATTTHLLGDMPRDESRSALDADELLSLPVAQVVGESKSIVEIGIVNQGATAEADVEPTNLESTSAASLTS